MAKADIGKANIGLSVSTKSLLRLFGYAWLACMTVLIVVIAGIDWLADFRAGPHIDRGTGARYRGGGAGRARRQALIGSIKLAAAEDSRTMER